MSRKEDVKSLISTLNRVLKTVSGAETELKAAIESSASTLNTLDFNGLLNLSQDSIKDLKRSLEVSAEALSIAEKRS